VLLLTGALHLVYQQIMLPCPESSPSKSTQRSKNKQFWRDVLKAAAIVVSDFLSAHLGALLDVSVTVPRPFFLQHHPFHAGKRKKTIKKSPERL
jgi:hypothetical protein